MSVICQTFVQNTWKKDLCSNCFKSKEEHEGGGGGGGGGDTGHTGLRAGLRGSNGGSLTTKVMTRGLDGSSGVGGGSKRYMGVAGSVYQRSYYNRNSWNSMMLEKSDSGLKSPGLIKGMSNMVSHENEKNLKLSDMADTDDRGDSLRSSRLVQHVKTSQSEAKLLSELLGNGLNNEQYKNEKKEPDKSYIMDKGDASSDLGSEASNDISSTSSTSSASSYEVTGSAANSDTTSVRSDAGSEQFEGDKDEYLGRDVKDLDDSQLLKKEDDKVIVCGILKKAGDPKGTRGSIIFRSEIEEVIGYGGDVDYSDDEDMYDDDDDDDDFDDFVDLTPDERVLRRLTEKNTDFNSDNDNLKKDIEELLPSVKELEEKRKMIIAEIEELERLGRENRSKTEKVAKPQEEKKEEKPEGKVKLKRSPPLVTIKPLIARNNNEVRVNQVLPMKNGEIVRPGVSSEMEEIPLKGIKPKYVSKEEEMVEKLVSDEEMKVNRGKITSIDDCCITPIDRKEKVTSIDAVLTPVIDETVKSGECIQNEASAITRMDNLLLSESQDKHASSKQDKDTPGTNDLEMRNIETSPALSVTPRDSNETKTIKSSTKVSNVSNSSKVSTQDVKTKALVEKSDHTLELHSDTKQVVKKAPVSAPRKSLLTSSQESKSKEEVKEKPKDIDVCKSKSTKELSDKKESTLPEEGTKSQKTSPVQHKSDNQNNTEIYKTNTSKLPSQVDVVPNETVNSIIKQNSQENPSLPETPRSTMLTNRLSLNHEILEIQTFKEPLRISTSNPDEKPNLSPSSEPEIPKTPENSKTPASRQGSNSSLFTTFGTPVHPSTSQNSFLHSSRSQYEKDNSSSPIYSPETTDFLKDIKTHPEVPTPTAGIQKSALYASTSCLKGLPGAKPVITPKPPILKDKPKVPYKPTGSTSRIYATPSPVNVKPLTNISGAISTPNLPLNIDDKDDTSSDTASNTHSEASSDLVYKAPADPKKPPPTTNAPAIPTSIEVKNNEVVYDIPVTVASSHSSNAESISSRSSPVATTKVDDVTIYHEIDDSLKNKRRVDVSKENQIIYSAEKVVSSDSKLSPSSVERVESTRCQSRSTFEANRSLLSAALDFGTKANKSSDNKRSAPQPPPEELINDQLQEVTQEISTASELAPESLPNVNSGGIYEDHSQGYQPNEAVPVPLDNNDGESYSSFTDDFDDDEDEEEEEQQDKLTLRKSERSSSAIPFYRNSVGPVLTYDMPNSCSNPIGETPIQSLSPGWDYGCDINSKPLASRSHSVPRVAEHMVITDPSPAGPTGISSKFSFGRSGFFRPSSPPTVKRDNSDRGRDRTKKSSTSRFSLKKLLRFGSKEDSDKKSQKEHEKRILRESKKGKLQIIHPLDYNQNGVEVIARPEKTSPIYDYTGIYGYIPPPRMSSKLEDVYGAISQALPVQASPAPSLSSNKHSQLSCDSKIVSSNGTEFSSTNPTYATPSMLSVVSTKSSFTSQISSSTQNVSSPTSTGTSSSSSMPSTSTGACSTSSMPSTSSIETVGAGGIYGSVPTTHVTNSSNANSTSTLEKKSSFLRKESHLERCESGASHTSSSVTNGQTTSASHHLGYNSEGRPKPPPPPRKVSLESAQTNDIYSSVAELMTPKRPHSETTITTETPSRPLRPPPPTRTLSNAGSKSGPPRPEPPKLGRDSVYANLGDVRAPITPRKPGRSASIRGEEDREKRRAPQPPQVPQEIAQQAAQRTIRHQKHDSTSSSCSSLSSTNRANKGPAPPRPQGPQQNNDYEQYEHDSASASNVTQIAVGSTTSTVVSMSRIEDVYQVPQNNSQAVDSASAPSLRQEKTGRLSVRRGSAVTHRSLEDQYGAVISANLEALSNMLDQLSNNCCPPGYEEVSRRVQRWENIVMDDDIVVGAGHRLFYAGEACGREITLMLTPETKVDAHHLLTPMPITTFKDKIPTHLLSHKTLQRGKTTLGTVWVLPSLSLTTLRTLAEESLPTLLKAPHEWERHTSLLLLQYVTGLKQLQAQGVEETCMDLTLAARGSIGNGQDPDPRVMLVPPVEAGVPVMSLCECASAATLMLMGVDSSLDQSKDLGHMIPSIVPSQHAFKNLLQILGQEKAGSLTQVKCILEVLLFGPDNSGIDGKSPGEVESILQKWLDLERATVLHTLIGGPLESSVLTKYNLLFLVRTNSRILRETLKLLDEREETNL